MRLADMVEIMLRETILAFGEDGDRRRQAVKGLDDPVDRLQEEIKLYLTRLTRNPLSEEDSRRAFDLILFTTNLEHIGDIIDKRLLELAAKKSRLRLAFSPEGWAEITALHARVVDQMRLAMTVFVTRDIRMARSSCSRRTTSAWPSAARPRATCGACAKAPSPRSRRARCTSTSCAT